MRTRLLIVAIALTVGAQTAPILIDHHKAIRLRDGVTVDHGCLAAHSTTS